MVAGNVVTTTGSGLDCPDWPLCYGSVTPPLKLGIWLEWGHRLLGGATGILILFSTILAWVKSDSKRVKLFTFTALCLLGIGAAFGGIIVLIEAPLLEGPLHLAVISFHIILATLIFSILILALRSLSSTTSRNMPTFYFHLLGLISLQIVLGIFVKYTESSLACGTDFPLCQGLLLPNMDSLEITLHFFHRVIALAILLYITLHLVRSITTGKDLGNAWTIFTLVIFQGTVGAFVVWSNMYLPYVVLHGATGFFILGWTVYKSSPFILKLTA
jgi:cytochrome c oxidase assembly protein subunit 15|tara:strand:+ start:43502 stop:44320 length:819 start_codon:yes stop_codon:yes gene_type:complete